MTRTVPSPPERPCARYVISPLGFESAYRPMSARTERVPDPGCRVNTSRGRHPPPAGRAPVREIRRLDASELPRRASRPETHLPPPASQVDRFIPSRSALDLDIAHYNLVKENASSADLDLASEVASPSKVRRVRTRSEVPLSSFSREASKCRRVGRPRR